MFVENEKGSFPESDLDYRRTITKVRGGWTKLKIKKELKTKKTQSSESLFYKEICRYETPEEFSKNLFYHGSAIPISNLKPSILLKVDERWGGGSGEQHYSISLSKCRNIASNFTGNANIGNVAPVLIKRGAVVKELPDIADSNELDDIIEDLWQEGIDAVILGRSFSHKRGEQEIAILNPSCIVVGKSESFRVLNKPKMPSFNFEKLEEMWINASEKYKEKSLESWDNHNIVFEQKFGKKKDPAHRWTTKQENHYLYHQYNVDVYKAKLDNNQSQDIESFIKSKENNIEKLQTKKQKI